MFVNEKRAKGLDDLAKSRPWGPIEKTLANGILQLLSDRRAMFQAMRKAVLASEDGSANDAIQAMLGVLDPEDILFRGWTEERIEALRKSM